MKNNTPNFDKWIESRISKLAPARREKVAAFVEKMRLSWFSNGRLGQLNGNSDAWE